MVSSENDTDAVQLKKILEWELSLDARDLRSHAWYHGAIPRVRAEEIVGDRDGDFLVRDCTSQPGNYVLSCRSKGQKLHFVINKVRNRYFWIFPNFRPRIKTIHRTIERVTRILENNRVHAHFLSRSQLKLAVQYTNF